MLRRRGARRGATLLELLVAMVLAAVLLGAASSTLVRQRRSASGQATRVRAESQVRAALGELEVALDGLSPAAGDLVAGEARDTALQLRTVIAGAVACDSTMGQATLAAADTSEGRASGVAAAPRAGDTLWWRPPGAAAWVARRVTIVTTNTGVCAAGGSGVQALLRLGFLLPDTVPRGAPLRLTRQARYSFYHASDGSWQFGISEWSDVLHAFPPPQPVAGPFVLVAPGGARTGFRYFDAGGSALSIGAQGASVVNVARVRVTLVAPDHAPGELASFRRESLDVALSHAP